MNRKSFFKSLGLGALVTALVSETKAEVEELKEKSFPYVKMSFAHRINIENPSTGLIVEQISNHTVGPTKQKVRFYPKGLYMFDGSSWIYLKK